MKTVTKILSIILGLSIYFWTIGNVIASDFDLEIQPSYLEYVLANDFRSTISAEISISTHQNEGFYDIDLTENEFFDLISSSQSIFLKPNVAQKLSINLTPKANIPNKTYVLSINISKNINKNINNINPKFVLNPTIKIPIIISVTDNAVMTSKIEIKNCDIKFSNILSELIYQNLRITDSTQEHFLYCDTENNGLYLGNTYPKIVIYQNQKMVAQDSFDTIKILPNLTYKLSNNGLLPKNISHAPYKLKKPGIGLIKVETTISNDVNSSATKRTIHFLSIPYRFLLGLIFVIFILKQYLKYQTQSH